MDFYILKDLLISNEVEDIKCTGEYYVIFNETNLHDKLCGLRYNGKIIEFDDDLYDEMCRLLPFFNIPELNIEIIKRLF